jgi:hypothetical protein
MKFLELIIKLLIFYANYPYVSISSIHPSMEKDGMGKNKTRRDSFLIP